MHEPQLLSRRSVRSVGVALVVLVAAWVLLERGSVVNGSEPIPTPVLSQAQPESADTSLVRIAAGESLSRSPRQELRSAYATLRVRATNGTLVADARVGTTTHPSRYLEEKEVAWVGHTNDQGRLQLPLQVFQERALLVTSAGFRSRLARPQPALQEGEVLDVRLAATSSLNVRVIGAQGRGVSGARVYVSRHLITPTAAEECARAESRGPLLSLDDWAQIESGVTDSDGQTVFGDLAVGRYHVVAREDGFVSLMATPSLIEVDTSGSSEIVVKLVPLWAAVIRVNCEVLCVQWSSLSLLGLPGITTRECQLVEERLREQYPDCRVAVFVAEADPSSPDGLPVSCRALLRQGGWRDAQVIARRIPEALPTKLEFATGADNTGTLRIVAPASDDIQGWKVLAKSRANQNFSAEIRIGSQARVPEGMFEITSTNALTRLALNLPIECTVTRLRDSTARIKPSPGIVRPKVEVTDEDGGSLHMFRLVIRDLGYDTQQGFNGLMGQGDFALLLCRDHRYHVEVTSEGYETLQVQATGQELESRLTNGVLCFQMTSDSSQ